MKNLYYMIWADAILSFKKHHPNEDWKIKLYIYITCIHSLNFGLILFWIKHLNFLSIPSLDINIFPGTLIDSFLSFTLQFSFPFLMLNYFLIFYNNRYKKILYQYKDIKRKYALYYSVTIAILAFISAIMYGLVIQ